MMMAASGRGPSEHGQELVRRRVREFAIEENHRDRGPVIPCQRLGPRCGGLNPVIIQFQDVAQVGPGIRVVSR